MPIDTTVAGDPASLRATAQWLRDLSGRTHDAGTATRGAVTTSESAWTGDAADGFRDRAGRAVGEMDRLAATQWDTAAALDAHAADLDTVRSRMAQVRGVATAAGLPVLADLVCEPPDAGAPDYEAKARAYQECVTTATEADATEKQSQSNLTQFIANLKGKGGDPWSIAGTVGDAVTGGIGGYVGHKLFHLENLRTDLAARVTGSFNSMYHTAVTNPSNWLANADARLAWALEFDKEVAAGRQVTQLIGPYGAPSTFWQSVRARTALWTVGDPNAAGLSRAGTVIRSVPVIGVGFTLAGIGLDVYRNPTWETAVISTAAGAASLVAATAVGALLVSSTPVWVPVLTAAAVGVVVDATVKAVGDDVVEGAKDFADYAGDKAKGFGKSIAKGLGF